MYTFNIYYLMTLYIISLSAFINNKGFIVRDLLAAAKASPWLGLGTSLKIPWACSPFVLLIGSSLYTWGIAYPTLYHIVLFHRLLVIYAQLTCSLPYTLAIRLTGSIFSLCPF